MESTYEKPKVTQLCYIMLTLKYI